MTQPPNSLRHQFISAQNTAQAVPTPGFNLNTKVLGLKATGIQAQYDFKNHYFVFQEQDKFSAQYHPKRVSGLRSKIDKTPSPIFDTSGALAKKKHRSKKTGNSSSSSSNNSHANQGMKKSSSKLSMGGRQGSMLMKRSVSKNSVSSRSSMKSLQSINWDSRSVASLNSNMSQSSFASLASFDKNSNQLSTVNSSLSIGSQQSQLFGYESTMSLAMPEGTESHKRSNEGFLLNKSSLVPSSHCLNYIDMIWKTCAIQKGLGENMAQEMSIATLGAPEGKIPLHEVDIENNQLFSRVVEFSEITQSTVDELKQTIESTRKLGKLNFQERKRQLGQLQNSMSGSLDHHPPTSKYIGNTNNEPEPNKNKDNLYGFSRGKTGTTSSILSRKIMGAQNSHISSNNAKHSTFNNNRKKNVLGGNAGSRIFSRKNLHGILTTSKSFLRRFNSIYVGTAAIYNSFNETSITPQECRLRDLTYDAPIYVDIDYMVGHELCSQKKFPIGRIPIMLRSSKCVLQNKSPEQLAACGECPLDPGGYFICKGKEKVILLQEQTSYNRIFIAHPSGSEFPIANVTSSSESQKSRLVVQVKSSKFYVSHSIFAEDIPFCIFLKALGVTTDLEIINLVGSDDPIFARILGPSIQESTSKRVFNRQQALGYISERINASVRTGWMTTNILKSVGSAFSNAYSSVHGARSEMYESINTNSKGIPVRYGPVRTRDYGQKQFRTRSSNDDVLELFSTMVLDHVKCRGDVFIEKAMFIAQMARRIILAYNNPDLIDDLDYYGHKRLEVAGTLVSLLFEDAFKRLCNDIKKNAQRVLTKVQRTQAYDATKSLSANSIGAGITRALVTGNWRIRRFKMNRIGVTQVLSRLSYISSLGMLTRIASQFEKSRKVSGPRALQPSQWGVVCPSDTPEGEACGLVKNLALLSHVTPIADSAPICRLLSDLGVQPLLAVPSSELYRNGNHIIWVNGSMFGIHQNPFRLCAQFRALRRSGFIPQYASIYLDHQYQAVRIAVDGGRLCRPLFVVKNGQLKTKKSHLEKLSLNLLTFDDFISLGLIEFVDVNEEINCIIALYEKDITDYTTHMEIDPLTLLGVCAALIPFPHHNQSPRNTYQCAMGKQAIGNISFNHLERIDTLIFSLTYSQKPLCSTRPLRLLSFDKLPGGHNSTVAIMSYSGYDIEDALVINRSSLDRGFGRCVVYRKYETLIEKHNNRTFDILQGSDVSDPNHFNYSRMKCLDNDGVCRPSEVADPHSVLINKSVPIDTQTEKNSINQHKPAPVSYRGNYSVFIDKVMLSSTGGEDIMIKIKTRHSRRPEVGDKFSSRHGQKGVIGIIVPQPNMPVSQNGLSPDIIMNPHGFPSRMTIGKMYELMSGKNALFNGVFGDGTTFSGDNMKALSRGLIMNGFNYSGKDLLISGITGKPHKAYIFFGPIYYQKLKHMVVDKMHARSRGPRALVTRQPTEGRSRDGGLRLGEMERDCLIGHGASLLLLERLMLSSDAFTAHVCKECGFIGYQDWCQHCRSKSSLSTVTLPYACKLLFQEMLALGIVPKIGLDSMKTV